MNTTSVRGTFESMNWDLNKEVLESMGINPDMLGKTIRINYGVGHGQVIGLNPRSKRPVRIRFQDGGKQRVLQMTLESFKKNHCK